MKRVSLALALLVSGFVAGLVVTGRLRSAGELAAEPQAARTGARAVSLPASLLPTPPDFSVISAQAVKGVVNISSVRVVRTPNSPWANDPLFQYFFGSQDDMFGSTD